MEMDDDNLNEVMTILNKWWRDEHIPDEELKARVVMIYKKGSTSNIDNYRPISLINTMTKMFAAILKTRIAAVIDPYLHKTQYGFRKNKSTSQAIHIVRRMIDIGERTTKDNGEFTQLILLDWEKAFDKVDQAGLFEAMERMGIDPKLISLTKQLYKK